MIDGDELERRIGSFARWHYEFDLGGHKTPVWKRELVNKHAQRKAHLIPALTELCGGSLKGKRVLDLACNAGFWSLAAIEAGAEEVIGVDGRQMHVDQAELVFQAKEIPRDRYRFVRSDVFDLQKLGLGRFDVVLLFGLFYHVSKHVALLEAIDAVNDDVLFIDTRIDTSPESILRVVIETVDNPKHALDHPLVMIPSRSAVLDMVGQFGYRGVVLKPEFTDWAGAKAYREGYRRAFLCAKKSDPRTITRPIEHG
jgi:tRNA (mo5U34)-methyltransferase